MLCGELNRIKGSRSNKRRKLLTCFTNSLFKVYNNLSLRETGPEVYNTIKEKMSPLNLTVPTEGVTETNVRKSALPLDLSVDSVQSTSGYNAPASEAKGSEAVLMPEEAAQTDEPLTPSPPPPRNHQV